VSSANPFKVVKEGKRKRLRSAPGFPLVDNGIAKQRFTWGEYNFAEGDQVPCPGGAADLYPHCQFCGLSGLLKVVMADPEIFRLGYVQITTGSGRNYDAILGTLEAVYAAAGRVSGIPFVLRRVAEAATYYDEDGQRRSTTKYFLQLEPEPELMQELYRQQAERMIGKEPEPAALLPAPGDESEEDYLAEAEAPPDEELTHEDADLDMWLEELSVERMIYEAVETHNFCETSGAVQNFWLKVYGASWREFVEANKLAAWKALREFGTPSVPAQDEEQVADWNREHPWPAQVWEREVTGMVKTSRMRGSITTVGKGGEGKGQLGMLLYLFSEANVENKERRSIMRFLLDKGSLDDLTKAEAHVLITLMKEAQAAETLEDEMHRILRQVYEDAGQTEMAL
jgi:hypothetical protein